MSFKSLVAIVTALGVLAVAQASDTPRYVGVWKFNSEKTLASIQASKEVQSTLTDVEKYGKMLLYPEYSKIKFTTKSWGYMGSKKYPEYVNLTEFETVEVNENFFRFKTENYYTREAQELVVFFEGNCIYWPARLAFNYYFCLEQENS